MQAAAELLLTGVSTLCFTLQFLPEPVLKLQKSLRLPNSALSLRLRYEAPLEALDDPFRPPARLLVRSFCAFTSSDVSSSVRVWLLACDPPFVVLPP